MDDFRLQETKLRPQMEHFTRSRVNWLKGVEGAEQWETGPTKVREGWTWLHEKSQ